MQSFHEIEVRVHDIKLIFKCDSRVCTIYIYVFVSYQYIDTSSNFDVWYGIMVSSNEYVVLYE
jgi:hypothetical protein